MKIPLSSKIAEDKFAISAALGAKASVLDAQILSAKVSPGLNGLSGHVGGKNIPI